MKLVYWFLMSLGLSAFWSMEKPQAEAVVAVSTCACDRMSDSLTLVELYDSTSVISDWQDPWDFSMPMDTWAGVKLNSNGCVTELWGGESWNGTLPAAIGNLEALTNLQIDGDLLQGSIPSAIGNLSKLRTLKIQSTSISGGIPESIYDLTLLRSLNLSCTKLGGTLSEKLGQLTNLYDLTIGGNPLGIAPLNGEIPNSIGNLSNLVFLDINHTRLSGPIPPSIGDLSSLVSLEFENCDLSGPLPDEIAKLTNLRYLELPDNELSGQLPDWIGDLSELEFLILSGNDFDGPLPGSLVKLSKLGRLHLFDNRFSGAFMDLSPLQSLYHFELQQNEFSGDLPASLGNIPNLATINLSENKFTGTIPSEWLNLSKLSQVHLNNNKLTGEVPPFYLNGSSPTLNLVDNQLHFLPKFSDAIDWNTNSNTGLRIKNNKFTFDDILPNYTDLSIPYGPQDTIYYDTTITVNYQDSITIDLEIDPYLSSNNYYWYQDSTFLEIIEGSNKLTIPDVKPSDAGTYRCWINNDSVFLFSLLSHPIRLVVIAPGSIGDSLELVKFYQSTDGPNWINPWNLHDPMDTWDFIELNADRRVSKIEFEEENNLNGSLIDFQLPFLTDLIIRENNSLGSILPNFSGSPELIKLDLRSCNISGAIPNFSNLERLEHLDLEDNDLSGPIPEFTNFPFLKFLDLSENRLSGGLPEFDQLGRLISIIINDNTEIEGNLPTFANNPFLQSIYAENCDLSGAIPSFSSSPNMQYIDLTNNHFTSIPDTLDLLDLKMLDVGQNEILGTIPVFNSTKLWILRLNDNQFYGTVPDLNQFSGVALGLASVILSNNNLSGPIPDVSELEIHNYYLNGNQFTSLPDLSQITSWNDCVGDCGFSVRNNILSFDDLIPNLNATVDGSFDYFPQDSFLQETNIYLAPNESHTIQLHIDEDLTTNTYQWYKNGFPLTTTTENFLTLNNLDEIRTDTFHCQVTNPAIPDLVLNSRATIIHVCAPSVEFIEPLLCVGESMEVNGTVYDESNPEGMELIDVPNEVACDSLLEVVLRFYPKSEKIINDTISEGSSVELNGTSYDATGNYEVLLVGQGYTGCDSSIMLNLVVSPITAILENEFPNSFTPNNDGINDYFVIPALDAQPEEFVNQAFTVFNRQNQTIYHAQPYNNDWDGTSLQGQALPTGTYYYVFRYEQAGKEIINRGKILLNR